MPNKYRTSKEYKNHKFGRISSDVAHKDATIKNIFNC